ncbi:dicarboxylate/amino acid:cation symporter [Pseudoflavonifractor phocaeensis]|uniref:dicarboxylate/amino acid:cation symporter n=1 Tax=Pseudoflavonifractor phocaeensis TaxID=1870988 RepID=UPI001F1BA8C2|nr:dicarboxylate/amino acid:cation symporter [Pseudoflavonifractor phocaeensis]MCF2662512.1 dicarboxylate/amino acid:cation symporter [Pseudoflavonifractor phocaeensis]
MKSKKMPLAMWIFVGLVVGVAAGLILMAVPNGVGIAKSYIKPWGTIFLNLLKFIVVPIVLFSIASGVISMQDISRVGSVGGKTVIYYMCTTAFAVILALILSSAAKAMHLFTALSTSGLEYTPPEGQSLMNTIVNIFPSNIIAPLANATMLQVIVISLLLGFGILLAGEKGLVAAQVVDSFNEVSMKIMDLIIKLSPVGVACLICPVVAENGPEVLGKLAMVLLVAYVGYIVHALIVYSSTVKALGGVSPAAFFKGMAPAMMMAFSSASSVGTLPFTLECSERLGARREVASFVLPLGATINMDGTAIYQGVCAVFIASCYGIDLTIGQMATIVLTATLASIGTAGVPGAGMVMLAMVLQSVNIPVEGIALVAGIDRIFDMGRTTVNITGDAACAVIVSKLEDRKAARTSGAVK